MEMRKVSADTRVIILSAGKSTRFDGVEKQQLPPNRYDTVVGRIIKQCELLDHSNPAIMVKNMESVLGYSVRYKKIATVADNSDTTCNTILSSRDLWRDRTIILLGDVVYSPLVINKILKCNKEFCVFGNTWEIFAVVFQKHTWHLVEAALTKGSKLKLGKIRYMYKYYMNMSPDVEEDEGEAPGDNFYYTRDWTRDIDSKKEYENTILELVNTHILDNNYV